MLNMMHKNKFLVILSDKVKDHRLQHQERLMVWLNLPPRKAPYIPEVWQHGSDPR
jgi:hypothetical protein